MDKESAAKNFLVSPLTKVLAALLAFLLIAEPPLLLAAESQNSSEATTTNNTDTAQENSTTSESNPITSESTETKPASASSGEGGGSPLGGGDSNPPLQVTGAPGFNLAALQAFQTDPFTGRATFSIPIAVPQGRKEIQPNLSLNYASGLGNGILGVGWSLELGAIERSTKRGSPQYNSSDTFVFNSGGSSTELVNIGGDQYRAKIEGAFMKFIFNGTSWVVTDKSGTKYYFGQNSSSQQENGPNKIFKWCLDKVIDINSNYLIITYTKDQNQVYPDTIQYTGNEATQLQPTFNVEFTYQERPDSILSYRTGFRIVTTKRLTDIRVKANDQLIRRYHIEYIISNTNRSLLNSITQYGSDDTTTLPPISFGYQVQNSGWQLSSNWQIPSDINFSHYRPDPGFIVDEGVRSLDINGDGFTDIIRGFGGWQAGTTKRTYLNNKNNGWERRYDWYDAVPGGYEIVHDRFCYVADRGVRFVDLNQDGLLDIFQSLEDDGGGFHSSVLINNGISGWTGPDPRWTIPPGTQIMKDHPGPGGPCGPGIEYKGVVLEDVNGDGLVDIVIARGGGDRATYINTGFTWVMNASWSMPDGNFRDGAQLIDVNGDGLLDIVIAQGSNRKTYLNTGYNWVRETSWDIPEGDIANNSTQLVDLNVDGLADIVIAKDDLRKTYINNGNGWFLDGSWTIPEGSFTNFATRLADVNGDGLIDILKRYQSEPSKIYFQNGLLPDLLTKISNGIAGEVQITYKSSTQFDNTGPDDINDLPFPVYVVDTVTTRDSAAANPDITTHYEYKDGLFDFAEREFRGFGWVKTTDEEGNFSESYFKQDSIYKGRPYRQLTKNASGNLYTKTENTWQSVQPYPTYPDVKFPYLAQTDTYTYEGDSTYKQSRVRFEEYDSYGNPTRVFSEGDIGASNDNKTQITEYTYNTSDWLLSFPKHTYLLDHTQTKVSEKWFYYDNHGSIDDPPTKGLLTKEEAWLYHPLTQNEERVPTTYTYDIYGNLKTLTDAENRTTTTTYDSTYHIYPVKTTNALGHKLKTIYYGINDNQTSGEFIDPYPQEGFGLFGQVKATIDPNNKTVTSIYDTFGRVIKTISPDDSLEFPTQVVEYDLSSLPIRLTTYQREVSEENGTLDTISFYDGLGRLIETKSESEEENKFIISSQVEFNSRGLLKEKYLPFFDIYYNFSDYVPIALNPYPPANINYDCLGRVIQTTNPDGTYSTIIYDDWLTTTIDENGHKLISYFDAYNRLIKKEEYTGADGRSPNYPQTPSYSLYAKTLYFYDTLGNLSKTQDAHNNTTFITYDSLSRKVQMNDPDMGLWKYEYDKLGNLIKQTDAKQQVINFEYDALNRLTSKTSQTGLTVNYTYDDSSIPNSKGRLTKATYMPSGNTKFYYDAQGREIKSEKTIDGTTYTVERSYDALDRLISVQYPDEEIVNYSYNSAGSIEQVKGKSIFNPSFPTKLLLHADGLDGSTTFIDSSPSGHRVTAQGNAQLDTGQSKFGGASALFDGSGDYLSIPDSDDWYLPGDWTIDFWVRFNDLTGEQSFLGQPVDGERGYWYVYKDESPYLRLTIDFTGFSGVVGRFRMANYWSASTDTWYHIAFVRKGDTSYMFINGVSQPVEMLYPWKTIENNTKPLNIGTYNGLCSFVNGWMDEIRISKGIARWTSNFTPPNSPTKLLLHADGPDGSKNFLDSSLSSHPVTAQGNAQLDTGQSKFGGASALFDGSGDYLSIPDSDDWDFGTGDFTIDFWVRFNVIDGYAAFISHHQDNNNYFTINYTPGSPGQFNIECKINGVNLSTAYAPGNFFVVDTWYHIAIERSGNTFLLFINGVSIPLQSPNCTGANITGIAADLEIGAQDLDAGRGRFLNGWIDEFRVSKGIARWTSNFTPPQAPSFPEEPYSSEDPYSPELQYSVTNVDYLPSGQISKIEYGNGTVTEYTYDPLTLRLTDLKTLNPQLQTIQDLTYTYDSLGNILQITDGVNSAHSQTFTYDELNRLDSANGVYGAKSYSYDEIGNILSKDNLTYTYGQGNAGPHAVTSLSDGTTFSYDENGNMLSRTKDNITTTYSYDFENRLKLVKRQEETLATFTYDGDGGRTKKTIYQSQDNESADAIKTTLYVGSLYEKTNNLPTKHIFLGSQRIASINSGNIRYFHTNHLGSTDVITNSSGEQVVHYEYSPYGSMAVQQGTDVTDYKFTGKPLDSEVGLYYYGRRYYDPSLGRFITADPTVQHPEDPQDLNRYAYCRNNPVNLVDPTGEFWFLPFLFAVLKGALIGSLIGGILAAATGQNIMRGFITGAISGAFFGGIGFGAAKFGIDGVALVTAHAAGGAASGAINASITGTDVGMNALIGGLSAGASKAIGTYVPFLADTPVEGLKDLALGTVKQAAIGALVGGTVSAAYGAGFGEGARYGAMTSAIAYNANFAAGYAVDLLIEKTFLVVASAVAFLSSPQVRTNIQRAIDSLAVHATKVRSKWRWPEPIKDAPGPDSTHVDSKDPFSWKPPPKLPNWFKWATATVAAARFFKAIYDVYGPPQFSDIPQAEKVSGEKK